MKSANKKERRKLRHERNKKFEADYKQSAWDSGKLIEERHDGESYSEDYTFKLSQRLVDYLISEFNKSKNSVQPELDFLNGFRKYRAKIRDLILLWSPNVPENSNYQFLKRLLEIYWDDVLRDNKPDSLFNYTFHTLYDK